MPTRLHSPSILVSHLVNFRCSFITSHPSFQRCPSGGTLEEAERGEQAGDTLVQRIHERPKTVVTEI